MRILLVESRRVFVDPERRPASRRLEAALEASGLHVAALTLPLPAVDDVDSHLACRSLALDPRPDVSGDVVIALDRSAARLRHPRRVLWDLTEPSAAAEMRVDAALAILDARVGHELVACFATSEAAARASTHRYRRQAAPLPIPPNDADDDWTAVVETLLDAGATATATATTHATATEPDSERDSEPDREATS